MRRQTEALFGAELDHRPAAERAEVLDTLEAVSSFEVVDLLVRHRHLEPPAVQAVVVRALVGVLTTG
jgi:hypothetical protein